LYSDSLNNGISVYLNYASGKSYSQDMYLVIDKKGEKGKIFWNNIKRIVMIGRANFSVGVIQRALNDLIPITFVNVKGETKGHVFPYYYSIKNRYQSLQKEARKNEEFCFNISKEIVLGKVCNSLAVLNRNSKDSELIKSIIPKIEEII
jgi:CRISP-associated protein Cas1